MRCLGGTKRRKVNKSPVDSITGLLFVRLLANSVNARFYLAILIIPLWRKLAPYPNLKQLQQSI